MWDYRPAEMLRCSHFTVHNSQPDTSLCALLFASHITGPLQRTLPDGHTLYRHY